jgi:hypothetical protein
LVKDQIIIAQYKKKICTLQIVKLSLQDLVLLYRHCFNFHVQSLFQKLREVVSGARVIRVMPNTPMVVGAGVSGEDYILNEFPTI